LPQLGARQACPSLGREGERGTASEQEAFRPLLQPDRCGKARGCLPAPSSPCEACWAWASGCVGGAGCDFCAPSPPPPYCSGVPEARSW